MEGDESNSEELGEKGLVSNGSQLNLLRDCVRLGVGPIGEQLASSFCQPMQLVQSSVPGQGSGLMPTG